MESHEPLTASEKSRRGGERLEAQEGFHVPGQDAAALKIEGKCKELNLANNLNEPGSKSPPPPTAASRKEHSPAYTFTSAT